MANIINYIIGCTRFLEKMCFNSDIWCFWGEIDEESFHLGGHRSPRWGCQKEAAKNGCDRDTELKEERYSQTWPRRKREGDARGCGGNGRGGRSRSPLRMSPLRPSMARPVPCSFSSRPSMARPVPCLFPSRPFLAALVLQSRPSLAASLILAPLE